MGEVRGPGPLVPASALAASSLLTIDIIRSHRSNFWVGFDAQGWLGAAIALAVYFAVILLLAVAVFQALRRVTITTVRLNTVIAITVSVAAVCIAMSFVATPTLSMAMGVMGGLAIGALIVNEVLAHFGWSRGNAVLHVSLAAVFVSWCTAEIVGSVALVDPERHSIVTVWLVGSAAVAAAIGFVALLILPFRKRGLAPAATLLVLGPVVAVAALPIVHGTPALSDRPSVLLVTFDALRADFLSVYGGQVYTPHFQHVSDSGATFERAYAMAPWTLPSVNALYGSQYPRGLTPGAPFEQWRREVTAYEFDHRQQTLAQRLAADGYATALLTGNGLVGQAESTRRGFDFFVRLGHHLEGWTGLWAYVPQFRELLVRVAPGLADIRPVDTTKVLTAYAEAFFRAHRGRPVFLWLHYMDPHSPYDPPERFRTQDGPWPLFCPRNPHWGTPQHLPDATLDLTPDERAFVQSLYEAEIAYADESLGRVMSAMDETGHGDAVVCLTADHGEELWDRGKWGHGHQLYDEVIRVPLIIGAPGVAPQQIDEPVSHIDVVPTLASLARTSSDEYWVGTSLAPQLLEGVPHAPRPTFARATNTLNPDEPLEMVAARDYKLIHGLESDTRLLYDVAGDAAEQNELSEEKPAVRDALRFPLVVWNALFPSSFEEDDALNAEVLEELQSLGYVE